MDNLCDLPAAAYAVGSTLTSLRWLNLGFTTFMPSELAKYTCIFLMAESLTKKGIDCRRLSDAGKFWAAPGFFIVMVALQPDLSTSFILFCITFYLYYMSGIKKDMDICADRPRVAGIAGLILIEPFRILRVKTLLDPFSDPQRAAIRCFSLFMRLHQVE